MSKNIVALAVVGAAVGFTCVNYAFFSNSQTEQTSYMQDIQTRVDDLSDVVSKLVNSKGSSYVTHKTVADTSDLEQRLSDLEHQLIASSPEREEKDVNPVSRVKELTKRLEELANSEPPISPAEIFDNDSGTSDWGEKSLTNTRNAYETEQFFAEYGGEFDGECRSNTCFFKWTTPNLGEDDFNFGMAELEVLAIATRDNEDAEVRTDVRVVNGQTEVSVYLIN